MDFQPIVSLILFYLISCKFIKKRLSKKEANKGLKTWYRPFSKKDASSFEKGCVLAGKR